MVTGVVGRGAPVGEPSGGLVGAPAPNGVDRLSLYQEAVEAGPDGVVIVSPEGEMVAFNGQFARMWPIPPAVVASRSDDAALQSVLDKLVEPEAFLARVRELYARADGEAYDELHLLDGRVFDRHGRALRASDGRYLGWAWYFRDVTVARAAGADSARMSSLVAVAHALGNACSESAVLKIVNVDGTAALGAAGAMLCLVEPEQPYVRALPSQFFSVAFRAKLAVLPTDLPLPMVAAATGGPATFLDDRAAAVRLFPGAAEFYAETGAEASAAVPLHSGQVLLGSLSVAFDCAHRWRPEDRRLLEALASLTAQALGRLRAQEAEQAASSAVRRMAETLQRSLLTAPPPSVGVEVAVRYQAAAQEAQVGGDWHDSFELVDGTLTLVVGDVAGHDRDAAAAMAQCRNVLRGVAHTLNAAPAAVLSSFDLALAALHVDAIATAVLCQVRKLPEGGALMTWSNAGHLPPVLVLPDGTARLLATSPDLLLGMQPSAERRDTEVVLEPGSTLVLYTDGLVERRGQDLDVGLALLAALAGRLVAQDPEQVCDALLAEMGGTGDDDVAVLVLHVP